MMFSTDEPNDRDLVAALGKDAIPCAIPCGDVTFMGAGSVRVVIERKKVSDMVSCITTGRYLNQAQAAKADGANHLIVVLEGQ
jgi:ERCC4-type nuclease